MLSKTEVAEIKGIFKDNNVDVNDFFTPESTKRVYVPVTNVIHFPST